MANTFTNLTGDIYAALDEISRELVGLIPAVSRDSSLARAAVGQTIRTHVAPESSASDLTAGQLPADNGDQAIGNKTLTISKSRYVPIRWNGEEQRELDSNGVGYNPVLRDQFAQAMRTLVNEIESDLASLYFNAARAVAPVGTTLFDAANYKDVANVRQVLVDNGAPMSDLHLILNTSAGAALRGNAQYAGANTAGREDILRQGVLLDVHGMAIRESAQIATHVNGTATGSLVAATEAIGSEDVGTDTGTGTAIAGDVIKLENDARLYVNNAANADVSTGSYLINAPGLRAAAADGDTITTQASLDRNMAFSRNAIHLITRAPAMPKEGDSASDTMLIQDPRSGLAFEVAMYKEHRQVKFEVAIAWGYEVIKPEHLALLID